MKNPRRYHGIVDTLAMGLRRLTISPQCFNVTGELVHGEQARGGDAHKGWKAFSRALTAHGPKGPPDPLASRPSNNKGRDNQVVTPKHTTTRNGSMAISWHNSTLPNAVTDQHCPKLGQERDPVSRARNNAIGVAEARHSSEHTIRISAA